MSEASVPESDEISSVTGPTGVGHQPARRLMEVALRCLPVALMLAVGIILLRAGGGFAPTTWYAAALFLLAVAVVAGLSGLRFGGRDRPTAIATAALAGYVCWTYLSIVWAQVPADAWQGANLTLLYALAFGIAGLWRIPIRAAEWIVLAYSVAAVVVGLSVVWAGARGTADPNLSVLLGGRLADPTSYPNATAAAFMLACWPALGIALHERMAFAGRAVALGAVVALAELSLLCQSRGSIFTLPVVVVVFLLLTRRRVIAALLMACVAAVVALAAPTLLAVYDAGSSSTRQDALWSAFVVIVGTSTIAAVAGLGLPLLDRIPRPGRAMRTKLRIGLVVAVIAAVAAVGATASPERHLQAAWHDFRTGGVPSGSSHFTGLGSNRYDFYRVGLEEFRDHPITGIGADNFLVPYLERRRSDEQPLYPHSLAIRTLSQTGVVGALLLTVFFAAAAFAVLRGSRGHIRTVTGGLLTGVAAWLLHGLADWLWEMPALGLAAFGLLGLAVGMAGSDTLKRPAPTRASRPRRIVWATLAVAFATAAALSFTLPWLSARYERQAVSSWRSDTAASLAALDRAAALNPLSDQAYVVSGAINSRIGALKAMRTSFERAVARNPVNWYAQLELATAASALGDRTAALTAARAAHRLNPREPITIRVLRGIETGHPLRPAQIDREFLSEDAVG